MVFDQEDWERRLKLAKTQEEIMAVAMELPESTETDDPASSTTGVPRPSTPLFLNTRSGRIQVG